MKLLAGLALGSVSEPGWAAPARGVDFFDAKGCVEDLADALLVEKIDFVRAGDVPYLHPGKAARITAGGEPLGFVGELHPNVLQHYELPGKAYLFEIDFERMLAAGGGRKRFKLLPKFPSVQRDLSIVVDESLEAGRMTGEIWASQAPFIEEVTLFDVYQGAPVPEGKKVLSYRVRYQSGDRTLTDEEVNRCHEEIISRLKGAFSAELR
jgi:phenylalanyl-tRNA synthetase beta chain